MRKGSVNPLIWLISWDKAHFTGSLGKPTLQNFVRIQNLFNFYGSDLHRKLQTHFIKIRQILENERFPGNMWYVRRSTSPQMQNVFSPISVLLHMSTIVSRVTCQKGNGTWDMAIYESVYIQYPQYCYKHSWWCCLTMSSSK